MLDHPTRPFFIPLPNHLEPLQCFERLRHLPYCCWLDSALPGDRQNQYSFLCAAPVEVLELERPVADPLAKLEMWLERYRSERIPNLPPFQGGVAGYLSYEFGKCFERLPSPKHDEFSLPIAVLALYDVVLAWDHHQQKGWLISQGFPERESTAKRLERAMQRAGQFLSALGVSLPNEFPPPTSAGNPKGGVAIATSWKGEASPFPSVHATAHGLTAPQYDTRLTREWVGNFDSKGYRENVQRARDYIYAGDIFQVNLSQRLLRPAQCDSAELYLQLRSVNGAPFAGYFDFGEGQILSASPERFVQVRDRWIETRPIKGTRRRTGDPERDQELAEELAKSPKDRAENTMIVDLLRNDLSKVCECDSVEVEEFCKVEEYPYVLHLVSSIRGKLREDATISDLFSGIFPGGSITGAPKIRAMEIIAELEPTARGPYCGSLGYCSSDGSMDWNILIRTVVASRGWWQLQVGGGIVAASNPELEEEETWTKAAGMVAAIDSISPRM